MKLKREGRKDRRRGRNRLRENEISKGRRNKKIASRKNKIVLKIRSAGIIAFRQEQFSVLLVVKTFMASCTVEISFNVATKKKKPNANKKIKRKKCK